MGLPLDSQKTLVTSITKDLGPPVIVITLRPEVVQLKFQGLTSSLNVAVNLDLVVELDILIQVPDSTTVGLGLKVVVVVVVVVTPGMVVVVVTMIGVIVVVVVVVVGRGVS